MSQNLKSGDKVMVIAGEFKGKTAEIVKMSDGKAFLKDVNIRERHMKKTYLNPNGGKKSVHVGFDLSNLKLVEAGKFEKKAKKAEKPAKTAKKGAN